MHSENKRQLKGFNEIFLHAFDISQDSNLPFVLFFKIIDREVKDIEIVELEEANIIFAFEELYRVIDVYVKKLKGYKNNEKTSNKFIHIFESVKRISAEKFIEYLVTKIGDYTGQHLL
ncbi:hypothetical protein D3C73_973130 [compost metagenome]